MIVKEWWKLKYSFETSRDFFYIIFKFFGQMILGAFLPHCIRAHLSLSIWLWKPWIARKKHVYFFKQWLVPSFLIAEVSKNLKLNLVSWLNCMKCCHTNFTKAYVCAWLNWVCSSLTNEAISAIRYRYEFMLFLWTPRTRIKYRDLIFLSF